MINVIKVRNIVPITETSFENSAIVIGIAKNFSKPFFEL